MYVNVKMVSVETIPGMRGRYRGEFKYDIFDTL
jgi:hypothetical protein